MKRCVFVAVLVLFCAGSAWADQPVDTTGLTVTAPPWHGDCEWQAKGVFGSKEEALERKRWHLAEGDAEGASKDLADFGPEGVDVLVAWLDDGAPRVRDKYRVRAALHVFRCGDPRDMDVASEQINWRSAGEVRKMLNALEGRVPRFTPEQAAHIASAPDRGVQIAAVRALIGSFKVQKSVGMGIFFMGFSKTVAVKGSKVGPPLHHVEAVEELLARHRIDELWHPAVKAIGTLYSYEIPNQDAWFPILLQAVRDERLDEDGKIGRAAALFIGRGLPERLLEGAKAVLYSERPDLAASFVGGLEDSIQKDRWHEDLRTVLELCVERTSGGAHLEAKRLLRSL